MFDPELLQKIRGADLDGVPLGEAAGCLPGHEEEHVRAAIHHLLWKHELCVDLTSPLESSTLVGRLA